MNSVQRFQRLGILSVLLFALGNVAARRLGIFPFAISPIGRESNAPELRGVWVQARAITSRDKIDEMLTRAEAGHFDAVFVNVFHLGQTLYASALADQYEKVDPDFDPLAYLVPEAHRRGLAVHAWFATGRVGRDKVSPIFDKHPEWALAGPDGATIAWLNFTRPDVRQFIGDLTLETVERYEVDGLHFDYMRYPGPEWGFDPYSIELFTKEYGLDLNLLRYADLPAYGTFAGNPLTHPGTAQVLATFANGLPAVTLNRYGEGEVVLLNWMADQRQVAVSAEIMKRSLERLLDEGGQVHIVRSEATIAEYGVESFENSKAWLEHLGWLPLETTEAEIANVGLDSVLVLPSVYLISPETAAALADFVRRGGGAIFLDGPTRSIYLGDLQALTGMTARGRYFKETTLMLATGEHPLIPNSQRSPNLETYQAWDVDWKDFRRRGINTLIKDIYERIKAKDPDVIISITITSDQDEAKQRYLQDWPVWLEAGYVDWLIPRGYVEQSQDLAPVLAAWQPAIKSHDQIAFGLIVFTDDGEAARPKSPDQLLTEIGLARRANSNGVMLFDLDRMTDEQLQALAAGPFASPAQPPER